MNLIEMQGFLSGKCLPGDMKVNETHAEYLVRKFSEKDQRADRISSMLNDAVEALQIIKNRNAILEHNEKGKRDDS
ncbi:TPA: hypothetical protein ACG0BA_000285 [Serratia odorifera]